MPAASCWWISARSRCAMPWRRRPVGGVRPGRFSFDREKSAIDVPSAAWRSPTTSAESTSFVGAKPETKFARWPPSRGRFSFVQHQSLVRLLPIPVYAAQVRSRGWLFAIRFQDYAAPLASSIERRWIVRHRLQKVDPAAERSAVHQADRLLRRPLRLPSRCARFSKGAGWWAAAFETATSTTRSVELLPARRRRPSRCALQRHPGGCIARPAAGPTVAASSIPVPANS